MLGLDFINKLKPAEFRYKEDTHASDGKKIHFGFMAQDIAKILDDSSKYAILKKDNKNYYLVDHGEIIAPLVKAVQELSERIENLERDKKHGV